MIERLNQDLGPFVTETVAEIVNAPLEDMLRITAERISRFFATPYTCIHFTKSFRLPKYLSRGGLAHCPLAGMPDSSHREAFIALEEELGELAEKSGQPLIHRPATLNHAGWGEFQKRFNLRSGLSIPLTYQNEVFAVIDIYHTEPVNLGELNPLAIGALGACLYGAAKKEVLIKSLQERDDVIEAFARTIEAADRYTGGHVDRVSRFAQMIGNGLGLSQEELRHLRRSALLHDVGKVGVPESILNKEGPLTTDERLVVETHPLIAQKIFKDVSDPGLIGALDGVLYHHERIDGRGYPFGLKGEAIPLQARIVAIADTFDALTSDRPYRPRIPLERALEILNECRGTQLDARLVEVFLDSVARE